MSPAVTSGRAGVIALILALAGAGVALSRQSVPAPRLAPTAHPPVPATLDAYWLAPDDTTRAAIVPETYAGLQEGVRRSVEGDFAEALPLLEDPAWASTPLSAHAAFYTGRTQLGLEHYAEAQQTFRALVDANPTGYLAEGALLGAAEAAEGLDQPEVALRYYEMLSSRRPLQPAALWLEIGQLALALGDRRKAADAIARVYYEYPLSDEAAQAATDLKSLREEVGGPGTPATFARDLERADRLYRARRWSDARGAYLDLRSLAEGDERALVDVRLAGAEVNLRRHRSAATRALPYVSKDTPYQAEARLVHAQATRALGRHRDFVTRVSALVKDFPDSPWAEAALDALGTHYILIDEDEKAAEVFADLCARYPTGPHAERAAWKAGWWAYRHRDWAGTARWFEGAAASFPRSNYRPAWLYWSGRARHALGDTSGARARLELAVTDYGSSYYGRLAADALGRLPAGVPGDTDAPDLSRKTPPPGAPGPPPPTAGIIRMLIAAELYDAALAEIDYARQQWGVSSLLDATRALVLNRQGDYRNAITLIRRAYPQYLTAGGTALPEAVQKIIYPVDYWPLVQKYSAEHDLEPYLVAALIAQESAFDAGIRSGANAYGLMQIIPATGRRVGRTVGLRRVTTQSLVDAETNLRLGTAHLAALLKAFGEPHLALAAYNAGELNVRRWIKERPGLAADEFIDDIPFPETQNYVRRILGTVVDYRRLYGSEK